ncbi:unnamed protein product [Caenorhabditis angaria]|uniref:Uncharacterized protein n=1 Tax=Caenorhabditis angaria TaxID=860376 RepID=A0A9P1IF21_9PELO|nr:unnamed protein product [Caenorhabditis angaria]
MFSYLQISVPIKKGELGKPVQIDVGRGVGPYYQENRRVLIDYLSGNIGLSHGIGVPMIGLGINNMLNIKFPSYNDFSKKSLSFF